MSSNKITLLAVGDISLAKNDPEKKLELILPLLREADFRFGQLEEVLATDYCQQVFAYPRPRTAKPGDPAHAWVLGKKYANFDVLSFASNHTLDWSENAMQQTIDAVTAEGCRCIGAGWDIEDAVKAAILEKDGTKIGILAYCCVLPKGYAAGKGKAGANPLRVSTYYRQFDWQPGTPPEIVDIPDPEDIQAMKAQIAALRKEVDILIVSIHWGVHFMPSFIADYQMQIGHIAIDAGADAIFGHHAHLVKGVEIYRNKPIFYSLGNLSVADVSIKVVAGDKQNGYFTFKPYRWRPDPEHPNYAFPYESRNAVMLKLTIEDKKISRFALLPLWIGGDNRPEPVKHGDPRFGSILEYIEHACYDQWLDTTFTVDGDEFVVNV